MRVRENGVRITLHPKEVRTHAPHPKAEVILTERSWGGSIAKAEVFAAAPIAPRLTHFVPNVYLLQW